MKTCTLIRTLKIILTILILLLIYLLILTVTLKVTYANWQTCEIVWDKQTEGDSLLKKIEIKGEIFLGDKITFCEPSGTVIYQQRYFKVKSFWGISKIFSGFEYRTILIK